MVGLTAAVGRGGLGEREHPGTWLAVQRLDYARQLLEDTDLPVDQIADRTGLGSGTNLRQQLRETAGVSPTAYRRMFRTEPAGRSA